MKLTVELTQLGSFKYLPLDCEVQGCSSSLFATPCRLVSGGDITVYKDALKSLVLGLTYTRSF